MASRSDVNQISKNASLTEIPESSPDSSLTAVPTGPMTIPMPDSEMSESVAVWISLGEVGEQIGDLDVGENLRFRILEIRNSANGEVYAILLKNLIKD